MRAGDAILSEAKETGFVMPHYYMRKTPKPRLFPSHVVDEPCALRPFHSRAASANPNPTASRVSVGGMIPSSHNLEVEYNAVD